MEVGLCSTELDKSKKIQDGSNPQDQKSCRYCLVEDVLSKSSCLLCYSVHCLISEWLLLPRNSALRTSTFYPLPYISYFDEKTTWCQANWTDKNCFFFRLVKMPKSGSEVSDDFEFIETPAAPNPVAPPEDYGVRTTTVSTS